MMRALGKSLRMARTAAMPSRITGWSSTVRIRMRLLAFMLAHHWRRKTGETRNPLRPLQLSGTLRRRTGPIGCCPRNYQFYFRPDSKAAPLLQFRTNPAGALLHPLQAPMARAPTVCEDLRIDAASIVANPQAK